MGGSNLRCSCSYKFMLVSPDQLMHKIVILDNIRSAHNVGSIFRTADGAGAEKIYLLGYTPAPRDRFGRVSAEIAKTSLGASETIPWECVNTEDATTLLTRLKADGFEVVAIEQTSESISLQNFVPQPKVAYIFGNEIDGVSANLIKEADIVVEIPMLGMKESLNVSVSAGIVLFH